MAVHLRQVPRLGIARGPLTPSPSCWWVGAPTPLCWFFPPSARITCMSRACTFTDVAWSRDDGDHTNHVMVMFMVMVRLGWGEARLG
jgi:hypothetical protein